MPTLTQAVTSYETQLNTVVTTFTTANNLAVTKAGEASANAVIAVDKAAEALASKNATSAAQTAINNRYRGALAADPATRLDGSANVAGDEYFSTASNLLKRWNGTTWQASDISTANLAAPGGAGFAGYKAAMPSAIPRTVEKRLQQTKYAEDIGAMGNWNPNDGTGANDTLAIQTALNEGFHVCLTPGKYYKVNGLKSVANGSIYTLIGRATLVNGSGSGETMTIDKAGFELNGVNFEGGNSGAAYSANTVPFGDCYGLVIAGGPGVLKNVSVRNCDLRGHSATGVHVGETAAAGYNDKSVVFENVRAHNNWCNWEFADKAEYICMTDCHGNAGRIGIKKRGGNCKAVNCNFTENYLNCWLVAGVNDSHGSWLGCSFNHHAIAAGARSLLAQTITYGEEFIGCKFWYGDIELSFCTGVRISNGQIAGSTITVTNGNTNWIHDNMLYGSITKVFTDNAHIEWRDNFAATDHNSAVKDNFVPNHYVVAADTVVRNFGSAAMQNLSGITQIESLRHSVPGGTALFDASVFKFPESGFFDIDLTMNFSAPTAVAQSVTIKFKLTDGSAVPTFASLDYKVFVPASALEFTFAASGKLFIKAGWLGLVQVTPGIADGVNLLSSRYTVTSKN